MIITRARNIDATTPLLQIYMYKNKCCWGEMEGKGMGERQFNRHLNKTLPSLIVSYPPLPLHLLLYFPPWKNFKIPWKCVTNWYTHGGWPSNRNKKYPSVVNKLGCFFFFFGGERRGAEERREKNWCGDEVSFSRDCRSAT